MPEFTSRLGFNRSIRINLGYKAVTTAVEKGLKLAILAIGARTFGREGWGQYVWTYALTIALVQMTDFGLGTYLTREIARKKRQAGQVYAVALGLKMFLSAGYVACLVAITTFIHEPVHKILVLSIGLSQLCQSFMELFSRVFQGFQQLKYETCLSSLNALLSLAALLAIFALGKDVVLFSVSLTGAGFIAALCGGCLVYKRFCRVYPKANRLDLSNLFKDMSPIGGAAIFSTAYFRAATILIGIMLTDAEAALYGAALQIIEMGRVIPAILMAVLFPHVSSTASDKGAQRAGIALMASAGTFMGLICYEYPTLIMGKVCGADFVEAAPLLRIIAMALPFVMLNFALTHYLIALNYHRAYLLMTFILLIMNLGLNTILIRLKGPPGAAWTMVGTEVCLTLFCFIVLRRDRSR